MDSEAVKKIESLGDGSSSLPSASLEPAFEYILLCQAIR